MDEVKQKQEVTFRLSDNGMGWLERAGLAGLYMSLEGADEWAHAGMKQAELLAVKLDWQLDPDSVRLSWTGSALDSLTGLVRWAWQVRDGVFFLPALHRDQDTLTHPAMRLVSHMGILATFLQPGRDLKGLTDHDHMPLDEYGKDLTVNYRRVGSEAKNSDPVGLPQVNKLKKIVKKGFRTDRTVILPSSCYPGAAKRFGRKGEKNWRGTPKQAFCLLFAPIGCFYVLLPRSPYGSSAGRVKYAPNWAVVTPFVEDLAGFARAVPGIHGKLQKRAESAKTANLPDAALRCVAAFSSGIVNTSAGASGATLQGMTRVAYWPSTSFIRVRNNVMRVSADPLAVRRYQMLLRALPNGPAQGSRSTDDDPFAFVNVPDPRGRIARNILQHTPWYVDLLLVPECDAGELRERRKKAKEKISVQRLWFDELRLYWRELMELANEEAMWDDPKAEALLDLFHSSLRKALDKEEKDLKKRGGPRELDDRWENKTDQLRRALMRAKTRDLLRKTVVELLAEAGGHRKLTSMAGDLWTFLEAPGGWQKVRDLALLALVTFTDGRLGKSNQTEEPEGE